MFAAIGQFHFRWHGGGQLHQLCIQKRHARLQTPGHGHIVHALDRVIDNQGSHIHRQHPVKVLIGFHLIEQVLHQLGGDILHVIA